MKISELIGKLQKAQQKRGNIEVTIDGDEILDFGVFNAVDSGELQVVISTSPAD